jgi:hypothetical protein
LSSRVTSTRCDGSKQAKSRASTSAFGIIGQSFSSCASNAGSGVPSRYAASACARAAAKLSAVNDASSPTRTRSWLPKMICTWSGGWAASQLKTAAPSMVACARCSTFPQSK